MVGGFQEIFFAAFGNSTFKFIWKYEGEIIPKGMPGNVFTAKWIPQQSVLSHPSCKGFITHGGLGSIHEAMNFGVPLIVLPIFMDNDCNAERVSRLGFGISLEVTRITQTQLETAIRNLTTDPRYSTHSKPNPFRFHETNPFCSYSNRMQEISVAFKDRQNSPLETALWWTEKVLRSSDFDLSLLRPLGREQEWYIRRLLDVWAFLLILIISPIVILIYLFLPIALTEAESSKKKIKVK